VFTTAHPEGTQVVGIEPVLVVVAGTVVAVVEDALGADVHPAINTRSARPAKTSWPLLGCGPLRRG
jgi:hypothetical protein